MSVYIESFDELTRKLGLEPNGRVQAYIVNRCYKAMNEFVPKDIGNLRKNVSLYRDRVTYESPYASYQYYGKTRDGKKKVTHYTTEGTGPYWDKRMMSAKKEEIIRDIQRMMK